MKVRNLSYHVAKLFGSRTGPNSHIWLEGPRLAAAGFAPGVEYSQFWYADRMVCLLDLAPDLQSDPPVKTLRRTVVNKGGSPAIRIEGVRVNETFGKHDHLVRVSYEPGIVTITRSGVIPYIAPVKSAAAHGNESAELAEIGVRL